jgi:hypothetical protein
VSTAGPIIESLEIVAEKGGDIAPAVIHSYHARCTDSAVLMDHMDTYMLGRMLDQVFLLLMEEGTTELRNYLEFETMNHLSYGVENYMYDNLFDAVFETVRSVAGDTWSAEFESAWQARIELLSHEIRLAAQRAAAQQAGLSRARETAD